MLGGPAGTLVCTNVSKIPLDGKQWSSSCALPVWCTLNLLSSIKHNPCAPLLCKLTVLHHLSPVVSLSRCEFKPLVLFDCHYGCFEYFALTVIVSWGILPVCLPFGLLPRVCSWIVLPNYAMSSLEWYYVVSLRWMLSALLSPLCCKFAAVLCWLLQYCMTAKPQTALHLTLEYFGIQTTLFQGSCVFFFRCNLLFREKSRFLRQSIQRSHTCSVIF